MNSLDRREFIFSMSAALAGLCASSALGQSQKAGAGPEVLGQGNYKWRVVPNWGVLDAETPVNDCHGMLQTKDGRIFLLTNNTKNNVIIYDRSGKLLDKWGTEYPGAHGFTLAEEHGKEIFYITDHDRHQVYKTSIEGKVFQTWDYPEKSGKYANAGEYKPTHVALSPDGGFYVADGYGKSWVHRYDKHGKWVSCFGGDEPGDAGLKCCHGAWVDTRDSKNLLWVTSRADHKMKRYTLDGKLVDVMELTGGQPNFIVPFGEYTFIPYLTGNNEQGQQNGFISILGPDRKIVANLAAPAPVYTDGKLEKLASDTTVFTFPHGLLIDDQKSIYIAQWNSGKTYPIKLERVPA
jgi:hypothetical protein